MKQTVWRVENAKHAHATRTGEGARIVGGRWTSPGAPAIYCAEHLSLAVLEVLVHAPDPLARATARVRFQIRIDLTLIERVSQKVIPVEFSPRTPYTATRALGDEWLRQARAPVLAVPSAIVPTERNFILNPEHPRFTDLAWDAPESITLDDRLWSVGGTG